jgi:ABC-type glycerol-3-phosphate transport system substrate-binding protein
MKYIKTVWKTFLIYFFVLALLLVCVTCSAQVTAMQFNASWNKQNGVEWFNKLGDCETESHMIDGNDMQKKYKIAVVPTIIIFDDGEEVKRFQADLSFKIQATRKEIQDYIDELIISKF